MKSLSCLFGRSCFVIVLFSPQRSLHFALGILLFQVLALIVQLPAAADAQQHFGSTFFEVHFQRHERQPFLVRAMGKLFDFAPMRAAGCGGHPSVEDHAELAQELVPFLKGLL